MNKYNVAFESGKLTYSEHDVDLYNSGVNQLLSFSALNNHNLFHFSMDDLLIYDGKPFAKMSKLFLPPSLVENPVDAYKNVKKSGEALVPLSDIQMFFVRGDDLKPNTYGIELLESVEDQSIFLESMEDTLTTCDKYEVVTRCPDVPMPVTYAAESLETAMQSIAQLPKPDGFFVLKDRFGYGCGKQVHRLNAKDPELTRKVRSHINDYKQILLQEYCEEVSTGDLVVTFFDGELIAPMQRLPSKGEWKTNASLGAKELAYDINDEQESIARTVALSYPGCRFISVDMLKSGKVIEVNAFPGGQGLYDTYGISIGKIILDKLEKEAAEKINPNDASLQRAI